MKGSLMKIEIKKVSQAGNNVYADMYFDGIRVTPHGIHCSPAELERFITGLQGGMVLAHFDSVVVED
jgi:hypothetical protein